MNSLIYTPPQFSGTPEAQLRQVYSYLFQLSQNLEVAMGSVVEDASNAAEVAVRKTVAVENSGEKYESLKQLIVNTAEIINTEMDKIETELHQETEAISSQFGTFQETIDSKITATAEAVVQRYEYDSKIDALQNAAAGFDQYKTHTEGFIRSGFIDYDSQGVPIIGVAIGQGLSSTKVNYNGSVIDQFDKTQSCAFYTAEKVSFRIQGAEVAYVSNQKLYIRDAEVVGTFTLGPWEFNHGNGLTIRWVGE